VRCAVQVLPALNEKQGEFMLTELVKRWDNHKVMVRWLSRFFNYLDRYYIQRHNLAGGGCIGGVLGVYMGCIGVVQGLHLGCIGGV